MKLRADRITNTELDQRLGAVAKGQANDRERLRTLEKENAELRESVAALTPKPQLLPDGHYESGGEIYDRLGNHAGILDQGKFVEGVPRGSSVLDDGRVVSACHHAWHRGRIVEGAYVDEPDVEIAKLQDSAPSQEERAAKIYAENARLAEERRGVWQDPFGIWRQGTEGAVYNPGAVDHQVEAVLSASQREHRKFLEDSGVENLRPVADDD